MLKMNVLSKSIDTRVEKLEDIALENVAGGMESEFIRQQSPKLENLMNPGSLPSSGYFGPKIIPVCTVVGAVGAVGCSVASAVCEANSRRAMKQGNRADSAKYHKAAVGLGICVAPFAAMGIGGGIYIAKHSRGTTAPLN